MAITRANIEEDPEATMARFWEDFGEISLMWWKCFIWLKKLKDNLRGKVVLGRSISSSSNTSWKSNNWSKNDESKKKEDPKEPNTSARKRDIQVKVQTF